MNKTIKKIKKKWSVKKNIAKIFLKKLERL